MPRVQRLQERQNRLKERADAALLMAMEFYQPQLSPVELQWLDEVALMKFEVSRMQKKCEQVRWGWFLCAQYLSSFSSPSTTSRPHLKSRKQTQNWEISNNRASPCFLLKRTLFASTNHFISLLRGFVFISLPSSPFFLNHLVFDSLSGEMMNHVERKLKVLELHLDSE